MRNHTSTATLLGIALTVLTVPAFAQRNPLGTSSPVPSAPPATATHTARVETAAPAAPSVAPAASTPAVTAQPAPVVTAPAAPAAPATPAASTANALQPPIRLRDINTQMQTLTEQIDGSKQLLDGAASALLSQSGAARAVIEHVNEMSEAYQLQRVTYALDGVVVLTRTDENGSLAEQHSLPVFDGTVSPGPHTLTISVEYHGHALGMLRFADGYVFRVRSTETFTARSGQALHMRVVGYERTDATSLEDRPGVRYVEQVTPIGQRDATASN